MRLPSIAESLGLVLRMPCCSSTSKPRPVAGVFLPCLAESGVFSYSLPPVLRTPAVESAHIGSVGPAGLVIAMMPGAVSSTGSTRSTLSASTFGNSPTSLDVNFQDFEFVVRRPGPGVQFSASWDGHRFHDFRSRPHASSVLLVLELLFFLVLWLLLALRLFVVLRLLSLLVLVLILQIVLRLLFQLVL